MNCRAAAVACATRRCGPKPRQLGRALRNIAVQVSRRSAASAAARRASATEADTPNPIAAPPPLPGRRGCGELLLLARDECGLDVRIEGSLPRRRPQLGLAARLLLRQLHAQVGGMQRSGLLGRRGWRAQPHRVTRMVEQHPGRDGIRQLDACINGRRAIDGDSSWANLDSLLTGTNAFVLVKGDVGAGVKAVQTVQKEVKKSETKALGCSIKRVK